LNIFPDIFLFHFKAPLASLETTSLAVCAVFLHIGPVATSLAEMDRASLTLPMFAPENAPAVRWRISDRPVLYEEAVEIMEDEVAAIAEGRADELVWLLEHPPLYTAGTSADSKDLLTPDRFPVFKTGRGGEYTYHGPGQRVAYVMLDLKRRRQDVRAFVSALEDVVIGTLADMNIKGERREDRVGVWVERPERPRLASGGNAEDKIAAIGIRLRKWVSFHGFSLNVDPALDHFSGIVPCGISAYGVTSLVDLGQLVMMSDVDILIKANFERVFGPVRADV
jgi:lipoyl(octanoyl) transferase